MTAVNPLGRVLRVGRSEKIDVTVATLNSGHTIKRCLDAIISNVPVRNLVVVDGGSTDDTLGIAKEFGATIIQSRGLLGWSRYVQAENCRTEWTAYFDSDVYVYESWWPTVSVYISRPDVAMMLGFADAPINRLPIYDQYLKYRAQVEGAVAFTNTLIRRKIVLECKNTLRVTHAGEDDVIAHHIVAKGLKIITIPKRLCFHDRDPYQTHWSAYQRSGASAANRYTLALGMWVALNSLRSTLKAWWRFSNEKDTFSFELLQFLAKLWIHYVAGFLKGSITIKVRNRYGVNQGITG